MGADKTPEELAQQILAGNPIVAQTTAAIGQLFGSTIADLSADIAKILQSNSGAGPLTKVVEQFTATMIAMLQQQVASVLPSSASSPSPTPTATPSSAAPPPPAETASKRGKQRS
jgi:hypothetical protein